MSKKEDVPSKTLGNHKKRRPPNMTLPQTTVTVIVCSGQTRTAFQVYKDYICYYSPFFKAAFDGKFAEGQTQTMDLCDTEPAVFGNFVAWLYSQSLLGYQDRPELAANLFSLWILADSALVPQLQNQIMRLLCGYSQIWCPTPRVILSLYARTGSGSQLRKLVVEAYALRSQVGEFDTLTLGLSEEIVFDIAVCLKASLEGRLTAKGSRLSAKDFYVFEEPTPDKPDILIKTVN